MADLTDIPAELQNYFDAADPPEHILPLTLMENILADAAVETSKRRRKVAESAARQEQSRGWLYRMLAPLGGFRTGVALAFCAVLGIAAGYAGTDTLQSLPGMGTIVSAVTGDPLNDVGFGYTYGFDDFLAEG